MAARSHSASVGRRRLAQAHQALASCHVRWQAGRARSSASQSWPLLQPNAYAGVLCNHLALLAARAGQADNAALLLGHADAWYAANQSPKRQAVEQRLLHAVWPMIDAALVGCAATRREAGARLGAAEADLLVQRVLSG